jgi:VWFA-related protein
VITGLSLALCGLTLAGIGEWAAGRFEGTPSGVAPAASPTGDYSGDRIVAAPPEPALPEITDHMPATTPGYVFRHDVPEVRLQFSVADEQGRLVNDLSSGEVQVFDNQSPVARFNQFERDNNVPLQVGLLVDSSDSVKRVLSQEKAAAIEFLRRVMRPQTDTAFVIGFAGDVKIWQATTPNRAQLEDAIARLQEPGWGTRIFDALYTACNGQPAAPDGRMLHRAIIVLTDGEDTDSLHTLPDVITAAQKSEVEIYPLTIHPKGVMGRGDRLLQRLAESTGGRLYVAPSARDMGPVFAQIEQDLRTQYFLSFSPPNQLTPGFHSLRVEVRAPGKLEVRARQGYYALQQ